MARKVKNILLVSCFIFFCSCHLRNQQQDETVMRSNDTLGLIWRSGNQLTSHVEINIKGIVSEVVINIDSVNRLKIASGFRPEHSTLLSMNNSNIFITNDLYSSQESDSSHLNITLKGNPPKFLYLKALMGSDIEILNDSSQVLKFENIQTKNITIDRTYRNPYIKTRKSYFQPTVRIENYSAHDDTEKKNQIDTESVSNKTIIKLNSGTVTNLKLKDCNFEDNYLDCTYLKNLWLSSINIKCNQLALDVDPSVRSSLYYVYRTNLYLEHIDVSKLNFDYTRFHYRPFGEFSYQDHNTWKSEIVSNYQKIIASQTRQNNLQGIEDATIELGIFQDHQIPYIGSFISFIKSWWNNYGFDKAKVIMTSTELFLIAFL